jgi:hypothetical protein
MFCRNSKKNFRMHILHIAIALLAANEAAAQCKILGNPAWDNYCLGSGPSQPFDDAACSTSCRVGDTPVGFACCTTECCVAPTDSPTTDFSDSPTDSPTTDFSVVTMAPTDAPTDAPTMVPTDAPSKSPTTSLTTSKQSSAPETSEEKKGTLYAGGAAAVAAAILVIGYISYKRMNQKTSSGAESNKVNELKGVKNPASENPTHVT